MKTITKDVIESELGLVHGEQSAEGISSRYDLTGLHLYDDEDLINTIHRLCLWSYAEGLRDGGEDQ